MMGTRTTWMAALVLSLTLAGCARAPIDTGAGFSGGDVGAGSGATGGFAAGPVTGGVLPGTSIGDTVQFAVDQSTLSPTALALLDQQIGWLQGNAVQVEIQGFADERGTEQYNIQLGARRASAVRDYMVSRGISDGRIGTNTFGRARPVATCPDESCWSQNRRAVTVVAGGVGA